MTERRTDKRAGVDITTYRFVVFDSRLLIPLYVGVVNAKKTVFVMIDAESPEWLFSDSEGRELRRRPASEITREKIVSLKVPGNK